MKLLKWLFIDLWDTRTEYEKARDWKLANEISEFLKRHPSFKMGERGGLSYDPNEHILLEEYRKKKS